jgi:hypothetical protein
VNGKARSRMPREGRDTSGACVGLMLVVHCQSLLNLHWIIFSRETVAAAGGYNKQAKRSPSPTSIPILSLQSVPDNTSRIQRYFSVATITIRAAENPVVLSAEREKMPAAVLLTSSPPLACSSSSFSMSSSLGAVVGAAKLPPSLPLLGHLHLIGCLPHRSLHALHLRGGSDGGLLPLQLGRRRAWLRPLPRRLETCSGTTTSPPARPGNVAGNKLMYGCNNVSFALYSVQWPFHGPFTEVTASARDYTARVSAATNMPLG